MIKHIVFWNLNEKEIEIATNLKTELEALNGKIEGLIKLEVGIDLSGKSSKELALYSELENFNALAVYQNHPLHQKVAKLVKANTTNREVIDYEI